MIYYNPLNKTYTSSLLEDISLTNGFTTKEMGDGRNVDTVLSFLRINQVLFKKLVVAQQIHSANILLYESGTQRQVEVLTDTDGIVTKEKGAVIGVRTADCIPILYADTKKEIISVSHNGWRGTLKGISRRIIEKMEENGSRKEDIKVALGPGIGACCYDVDDERYYSFLEEYETDFSAFSMRGGRRHLSLNKLNYEIIKQAGIPADNIDFFPFCTKCNKHMFYSYRRDYHKSREKFGEMFSYIVLN